MDRLKHGFTDSEISLFMHERELRAERGPAPPAPGEEAWQLMRSPPRANDGSLTTLAKAWHNSLPAVLQPRALCERFPRVANRLALSWIDPVLTHAVIRDLLINRRGRRKGFPEEVHRELVALQTAAHEAGYPTPVVKTYEKK
jgi:hypothetical protein